MTTLYKPVLIESAEQAEALPDGIVLIREEHFAFQKHAGRFVSADPHDLPTGYGWEVVGWTALVPIEAEEETHIDPEVFAELDARLAYTQAAYALPPGELQVRHVRRYVTPWTPANE